MKGDPPDIVEMSNKMLANVQAMLADAAERAERDLAAALVRERALRIVLETVMASLRPKGLRRRRFRERIAKAEQGSFGDELPARLRDALRQEAQRVLDDKR